MSLIHASMKKILFLLFSLLLLDFAYGEGTKELSPDSLSIIVVSTVRKSGDAFAHNNSREERRLNISIREVGEIIHFGIRQHDPQVVSGPTGIGDPSPQFRAGGIYVRIIDPTGNVVLLDSIEHLNGEGSIINFNEGHVGPQEIVRNVGGYDAISYTPSMTGDYYMQFDVSRDFVSPDNDQQASNLDFDLIDITVSNSTSSEAITGRVWSKEWSLLTSQSTVLKNTRGEINSKLLF